MEHTSGLSPTGKRQNTCSTHPYTAAWHIRQGHKLSSFHFFLPSDGLAKTDQAAAHRLSAPSAGAAGGGTPQPKQGARPCDVTAPAIVAWPGEQANGGPTLLVGTASRQGMLDGSPREGTPRRLQRTSWPEGGKGVGAGTGNIEELGISPIDKTPKRGIIS